MRTLENIAERQVFCLIYVSKALRGVSLTPLRSVSRVCTISRAERGAVAPAELSDRAMSSEV